MKNIFIAFIIGLSIIIGLNFDYFRNDGMTYISEFFYEISGQKAKDIREIKIRVEKLRKEKEIEMGLRMRPTGRGKRNRGS